MKRIISILLTMVLLAITLGSIAESGSEENTVKIILDTTNIVLIAGKSITLSAQMEGLPEGEKTPKLQWTTSDKKVVSVNKGKLRAISGGEAVVTCSVKLSDGATISSDCNVTVRIPVGSITTDKKTINLAVGETATPAFRIKPDNAYDKRLKFDSSDPDVATVNNEGVIQGIASGRVTITASAVDGSKKTVTITVNVKSEGNGKNIDYLKNTKGKDLYDQVVAGEHITNNIEGGTTDWYDRGTDIDGISFEVHSKGANGQVVMVEVLDIMNTKKRTVFYKTLNCLFRGEDLKKATDWLKKNIGKETQTKIGDAYIILQLTGAKAPIMYISDEEHKDWV